ncbi:MAG: hypothetical protein FJZ01_03300, partial [Candidatus Sericytochromatia bacterium]|nr:hypothetical protein [Candidatus Tanganyikabacteria bacterium]
MAPVHGATAALLSLALLGTARSPGLPAAPKASGSPLKAKIDMLRLEPRSWGGGAWFTITGQARVLEGSNVWACVRYGGLLWPKERISPDFFGRFAVREIEPGIDRGRVLTVSLLYCGPDG